MSNSEFTICLSDATKATLSDVKVDHFAFEAQGLVTASVTMRGVSVTCSGLIFDEEISTDDTCEEFDELFELAGLCDGQDENQESLKQEILQGFGEVLRPVVIARALCSDLISEKLEQDGFHLFGRDPYRNSHWHVGEYISPNTTSTYGHYETLLQLVNSFDWSPALFRKAS